MTKLNTDQEHILWGLGALFDEISPVLKKMEEDYEYAIYRAKLPLMIAVDEAVAAGIPMRRIAQDAGGFEYPQKLTAWLRPSDSVTKRLEGSDVPLKTSDTFEEDIDSIKVVTRNPKNGEFSVNLRGTQYVVPAMGPDDEPWSARENDIPQAVYDAISEQYPAYVVLYEDEKDW